MTSVSERIEHLEESVAKMQGVLEEAQKILSVADASQRTAGAIARTARRAAILIVVGGVAFAVVAMLRRPH
jgi:tRNA A37 N6-isopentenylltransferase MiaA